jgi:hypothetical protein
VNINGNVVEEQETSFTALVLWEMGERFPWLPDWVMVSWYNGEIMEHLTDFIMFMLLLLIGWNRVSIFLLKTKLSIIEKKLGIKFDCYGEECE